MSKKDRILHLVKEYAILYPDESKGDLFDRVKKTLDGEGKSVADTYIYKIMREYRKKKEEEEQFLEPDFFDEGEPESERPKFVDSITGTSDIRINADGMKALMVPKGVDFETFCSRYSFPFYGHNLRWQKMCHKLIQNAPQSIITVARDSGKTIYLVRRSQYAMEKGWDVLYLGWTDRRKEVAGWVFEYFYTMRQVIAKRVGSSTLHFELENGARFDTYLTTSKEILGKHPMGMAGVVITEENKELEQWVRRDDRKLLIIMDDPIDDKFREERWKEKDLERRFSSTIMAINPNQFIFCGTKKFQEDFFWYLEKKVYGKDVVVFKRSPYLEEEDFRYDKEPDNPANLTCPELWTHPDQPEYEEWKELQLLSDEETDLLSDDSLRLRAKKDITRKEEQMMNSDPYWWFSEYMQDPHSIQGEVWKDVGYFVDYGYKARDYDAAVIFIDRATTMNDTSDDTGISVLVRQVKTWKMFVVADYTRKITFHSLADFIEGVYKGLKSDFPRATVRVWIEQQGGGTDYYEHVKNQRHKYSHYYATDTYHSNYKKEQRILTYLRSPINNRDLLFHESMRGSLVIEQILTYPYCAHDDAIDALAYAYWKLESMPKSSMERIDGCKELLSALKEKRMVAPTMREDYFQKANKYKQIRRRLW